MPAFKDHSGETFGKLFLIRRLFPNRPAKYLCKCTCGNETEVFLTNLMRGYTKNCISCQALKHSDHLIGKKFHYLTLLDNEKVNGITKVKVKCDCGNIKYFSSGDIQKTEGKRISGKYLSCGQCQLASIKVKKHFKCLKNGFKKGRLTIIKEIEPQRSLALCECGNEKEVRVYHMQIPYPSCGCHITERNIENAKKLEGVTYFRLKIIKFLGMGEDKRATYQVKCKCGTIFEQSISYVFGSKSCGCLQKENVPKGSKSFFSKLNEIEVKSMRDLFKSGLYTRKDLAKIYEIRYETVCDILKGKGWKHVLS